MIPRFKPVTAVLVAACTVVYLLSLTGLQETIYRALLITQYIRPPLAEVRDGELWRLVTPVLLHFGLFHILFNMLWTWELGRIIEWRHGALSLIGLTVVIGTVSNLVQYRDSGPFFGGMSGVIYGYFGFVWIQSLINRRFGLVLNRTVVLLLLGWFALCWTGIIERLFGIGVANAAHTAGLLSGIVIAFAVNAIRLLKGRTGRRFS